MKINEKKRIKNLINLFMLNKRKKELWECTFLNQTYFSLLK